MDWKCFEYSQIDGNENLIPENFRKIKKDKTVRKFEKFWKIEEKKSQNSTLYSTQWPPDNWPDALDCLSICLVANKCTKLGKITEKLLLKLPLPSTVLTSYYPRVFNQTCEMQGRRDYRHLHLQLCLLPSYNMKKPGKNWCSPVTFTRRVCQVGKIVKYRLFGNEREL